MSNAVLDAYLAYRAETTALASGAAAARSIARSWNRCGVEIAAWPKILLLESDLPSDPDALAWERVPETLRREIDAYLASLARKRKSASGKRWKGAKASTIRTRAAEIRAFVRHAVRIGVAVEELTSLSRLLDADLVDRVIDSYREKDGGEPKTTRSSLAGSSSRSPVRPAVWTKTVSSASMNYGSSSRIIARTASPRRTWP